MTRYAGTIGTLANGASSTLTSGEFRLISFVGVW
jgi:hypothetical protein